MKKCIKLIIAFFCALVCSLLVFTSIENKFFDLFQRFLPPVTESKNVVIINADDVAIENMGDWSFSGDIYAESLFLLRELGGRSALFDLTFSDGSPANPDERYVKGSLPSTEISAQASLLASALTFFGSSFLSIAADEEEKISDEDFSFLSDYVSLKNVISDKDTKTPDFTGAQSPFRDFITHARGAGFVNANPDSDGYLRRLNLLVKIRGKYYGQLMLTALLSYWGNPELLVSDSKIIIKNAKIKGTKKEIIIPRDQDGSVILKFPKKNYEDYRSTSLWKIYRLKFLDANLFKTVKEMQDGGLFKAWDGENPVELYNSAKYLKESLCTGEKPEKEITYDLYFAYKLQYNNVLSSIISEDFKKKMMSLNSDDPDALSYISEYFDYAISLYEDYSQSFAAIKEKCEDAFCIIGKSAKNTGNYGRTLYEEDYPPPGLHYTIANQILSEDFIKDSPASFTITLAFILSIIYGAISCKMKSIGRQIVLGLSEIAFAFIFFFVFYIVTKTYLGAAIPILSLSLSIIGITVLSLSFRWRKQSSGKPI